MERGRVMDQGRHEELLERGGIYADLYRLQFQDGKTVIDTDGVNAQITRNDRRDEREDTGLLRRFARRLFG